MERYEVSPVTGFDPAIGRWLWAMGEARKRTLGLIEGLDQGTLDYPSPYPNENTIGSLLYHIAEVEMGWLWGNIRGLTEMPPEVLAEFPFEPVCGETGRITVVAGVALEEHVARLEKSREVFLNEVKGLTAAEWQTLMPDPLDSTYEATPEWILYHLFEHEMEHNEQISALVSRLGRGD